ncbi:MAG: ROK family protein [Cytophagales bacterium]|nr:ROK family protein [Cytophagales bacterium]MDW8385041.1 ROK family protein [Flammeovirgaceae bacterium]
MKEAVIGIDLGGTNTKYGLVDRTGDCFADGSIETHAHRPVTEFIPRIAQAITALLQQHPNVSVKAVGVGAPNGNYYTGRMEKAPNFQWGERVELAKLLSEALQLPVWLTNDANAAAIGEKLYGVAKHFKDFVVITLGTGLGSGIYVNNQLVYGHDGFAGEIGHTTVFLDGRDHTTGRKGSLETYVSATGIKRTVFELLCNRIEPSPLRDLSYNQMTAKHITEAALQGDKIALEAFELTGKILGLKLSDTVAHLSPEAIILFGGLANAGDLILRPTKYWMEYYNLGIFKNKTQILISDLKGDSVAIQGAAALAWEEWTKHQ